ncbi:MAG: AAA family ATPase [Acidobacteria bacterium]|nr:AAA family ATPase [Acidobacteriota bacterium]
MYRKGDEPLPGWRVRFVAGSDSGGATEAYRVRRVNGARGFLKVFAPARTGVGAPERDGQLPEIKILESLDHPGIPRVLETGAIGEDSRPYVLMELVPGETLEALLARNIALSPGHARELMRGLIANVARLHLRGDPVLHNRLTPAHVVLDAGTEYVGRAVLVGFGGARRVSDGAASPAPGADPRYLPNEYLDAPVLSPSVDVFSLGAVWFHVLFGTPPWTDAATSSGREPAHTSDLATRRREGPPPLPAQQIYGAPPDADLRLLLRALALDPRKRFEDAGAFRDAIGERPRDEDAAEHSRAVRRASQREDSSGPRGLDRIAGMKGLKDTLVADVVKPLRTPERYRQFGVGIPNGILLFGPPGCGKTFFAECLGQEIGFGFEAIRPSDVGSTYIFGSQLRIAELFKRARKQAPCVLFVDEVDALVPTRAAELDSHRAATVNEWLTQLNRAADDGVFVIAATNQPDRLDPAVLRTGRLDKTFYVGPPDREARESMFGLHLQERPLDGKVDLGRLADRTEGRIASDIRFLVDEAARIALAEDARGISEKNLMDAIRRNPPSLSREQIARYQRMHDGFDRSGERDDGTPPRRIGFGKPSKGASN